MSTRNPYENDDNANVPWETIHDPDATSAQLEKLIDLYPKGGLEPYYREKNIPPEDVRRNYSIATSAIMHPNLSVEAMEKLADKQDVIVDLYVARNPNCTPELLARFATDGYMAEAEKKSQQDRLMFESLRAQVAGHKNTPEEILRYIASNDHSWHAIVPLGENPSTPRDLLLELADDNFGLERDMYASLGTNPAERAYEIASSRAQLQESIAMRPDMDSELAQKLMQSKHYGTRQALAGNLHTPEDILQSMASNYPWDILNKASITLAVKEELGSEIS